MSYKRKIADLIISTLLFTISSMGRTFYCLFGSTFLSAPFTTTKMQTSNGFLYFWAPNDTTRWRAETLLTKEPETIEWIDGFKQGDVYWDIGANVGVYSIYAAKRPGVTVLAFEPSPFNYHVLCKNIMLNEMGASISAYCLAFSNETAAEKLNMSTTEIGGALSSFGVMTDYCGEGFTPVFRQAALGFTLDDFCRTFAPSFPNHIKIDVDGIEVKIIEGADEILSDTRLKSISIELNEQCKADIDAVMSILNNHGFTFIHRKHSPLIAKTEFASCYNYLFARNA